MAKLSKLDQYIFFLMLLTMLLLPISLFSQIYTLRPGEIPTYRTDSTLKEVIYEESSGKGYILGFTTEEKLSFKKETYESKFTGKVDYYGIDDSIILSYDPAYSGNRKITGRLQKSDYSNSYVFSFDSLNQPYRMLLYQSGAIAAIYSMMSQNSVQLAEFFTENGEIIGRSDYTNNLPWNGTHVEYYFDRHTIQCLTCYADPAKIQSVTKYQNGNRLEGKYFNLDGEHIGSGTFKNNVPFAGAYFNTNPMGLGRTLERYNNGRQDGEEIEYTYEMKTYRHKIYKEGILVAEMLGEVFKPLNIKREGIYKNGSKWNGIFLTDDFIQEYSEGSRDGITIEVNRLTYTPYSKSYRLYGEKTGKEEYYDKTGAVLTVGKYVEGNPFEGSFVTESLRHRFVIEKFIDSRRVEKNVYDGNIKEQLKGKLKVIASCEFKDDKPWNGIDLDMNLNQYFTYSNGIKNGYSFKLTGNNITLEENYLEGVLDGLKKIKGNQANTYDTHCIYKSGIIIDGYIKQGAETFYYKDGKIIKIELVDGDLKINYEVVNGQKHGLCQTEFKSSFKTLSFQGTYQNNAPWEGSHLNENLVCEYKNGKLNGICTQYTSGFSFIICKETYRDNLKDGLSKYYLSREFFKFGIDSVEALYSQGALVEGYLLKKSEPQTEHYIKFKDGKPTGDSLITSGIQSLQYKNDKVINGRISYFSYRGIKGETLYENGNRYVKIFDRHSTLLNETCNKGECKGENIQNLIYNWSITPVSADTSTIVYTDQDGKVIESGVLVNDQLISGCIRIENYEFDQTKTYEWKYYRQCVNKDGKHELHLHKNNELYHIYTSDLRLSIRFPDLDGGGLYYKFFNEKDYKVNTVWNKNDEILSEAEFKSGSLSTGIFLDIQYDHMYKFNYSFENDFGDFEGLSFEELMAKLNKLKKAKN